MREAESKEESAENFAKTLEAIENMEIEATRDFQTEKTEEKKDIQVAETGDFQIEKTEEKGIKEEKTGDFQAEKTEEREENIQIGGAVGYIQPEEIEETAEAPDGINRKTRLMLILFFYHKVVYQSPNNSG